MMKKKYLKNKVFLTCIACLSMAAIVISSTIFVKRAYAIETSTQQWIQQLQNKRNTLRSQGLAGNTSSQKNTWNEIFNQYPAQSDWAKQDYGLNCYIWFGKSGSDTSMERSMIQKAINELGDSGTSLQSQLNQLKADNTSGDDIAWLNLYATACELRRTKRLAPLLAKTNKFIFTKHFNMGGSFYAYDEALNDDRSEFNFHPGSALCELTINGIYGSVTDLITTNTGVIRNPDVSMDKSKVLFSWKKTATDDYHIYEMDYNTKAIRQLTSGPNADYECIYLPDGNIMFSTTRAVQSVDCYTTPVSNLYIMDGNGDYMRRVGYDQVHTSFPTLTQDGRVVYTRWDYSDRGQIFTQPLFQMNPDGTNQTAVYGENSYFPTTITHARLIPNTSQYLGIFTGHHSMQAGKLGLLDLNKGRQENEGAQLIAPVRETSADRIDTYGHNGESFQYPYPITEDEFLITFSPEGNTNTSQWHRYYTDVKYGLYFMDRDGHRELLTYDPSNSCNQGIPVISREPHVRPTMVDYRKDKGTYYISDIYEGPGLEGIARGTIKKLRVVEIDYRPASIGITQNEGAAGGSGNYSPPSVGNGAWDPKRVLGTVPVYEDGSAMFQVPARKPVYFQALDENGRMVQTMRSWSTIQPGEYLSCVGCHENKNTAPPVNGTVTQAMKNGVQQLTPTYNLSDGFSFAEQIQPILDAKCISCHTNKSKVGQGEDNLSTSGSKTLFGRSSSWQYTTTKPADNWYKPEYDSSSWGNGNAPFGDKSGTNTHWGTMDLWMRKTFNVTADQISDYRRVVAEIENTTAGSTVYINGRLTYTATDNTNNYGPCLIGPSKPLLHEGVNTIAYYCDATYTHGGRKQDIALLTIPNSGAPISLKSDVTKQWNNQIFDTRSKKKWSDAYLALTNSFMRMNTATFRAGALGNNDSYMVNWVSAASSPGIQKPSTVGARTSYLIEMLAAGQHGVGYNGVTTGVTLTAEELDKFSLWIDLGVPFCKTYDEANNWSQQDKNWYNNRVNKRQQLIQEEQNNIQQLINKLYPNN